MKDLVIVLCKMPFLTQPGLEPAARGLQGRSTDHRATAPPHKKNQDVLKKA